MLFSAIGGRDYELEAESDESALVWLEYLQVYEIYLYYYISLSRNGGLYMSIPLFAMCDMCS